MSDDQTPYSSPKSIAEEHSSEIRKMKHERILKFAVVTEIVLFILAIAVEITGNSEDFSDEVGLMWSIIMLLAFVGIIIAWIGLLFLKRWAAWLYLIVSIVAVLATSVYAEEYSSTTLSYLLDTLATMTSGFIIAMAFVSQALSPTSLIAEQFQS